MASDFWCELAKRGMILGLSPMDGVTDGPFRLMVARYGKPDLILTEFVSVDALRHVEEPKRVEQVLRAFLYSEMERPVVAQVFGKEPELFYQAAVLVAELGFDGMDINMGCPARKVSEHGAGAGLIRTPNLACELVREAKRGMRDYAEGRVELDDLEYGVEVKRRVRERGGEQRRRELPVSVKTRIGVESEGEMAEWIEAVMEVEPAMLSLHGRSLRQMYTGRANWEAIGRAAEIVHRRGGLILGNGDVGSREEAEKKVSEYGVDGVILGRASFGKPAVFAGGELPTVEQKLGWILEHAKLHEQMYGKDYFLPVRKHLAWYARGFPGASELRAKLVMTNSVSDVEQALLRYS